MNVVVELRRPARDGSVRLLHPRTADQRLELIRLAHWARCRRGLSYRQVVAYVAGQGARISLGTAWRYCNRWNCQHCRARAAV